MSIISYFDDPFFTVSDFNRLFNVAFDARTQSNNRNNTQVDRRDSLLRPRMDLHESKDKNELTATFELPGMKKEDVFIDLDLQHNRLTISGQSSLSEDLDKEGYSVRERRYGKFSRTIPIPFGVKVLAFLMTFFSGVTDNDAIGKGYKSQHGERGSLDSVPQDECGTSTEKDYDSMKVIVDGKKT